MCRTSNSLWMADPEIDYCYKSTSVLGVLIVQWGDDGEFGIPSTAA
jgi:hypothetical protein